MKDLIDIILDEMEDICNGFRPLDSPMTRADWLRLVECVRKHRSKKDCRKRGRND